MARIRLNGGFSIIDEGTYKFKVTGVLYKEDFGKLEVSLENESGQKHTEKYCLIDNVGNVNDKAASAFTFFAKKVLNIPNYWGDIDESWLVGASVIARVEHTKLPKRDKPNEFVTFAHLKDYEVVEEVKPNLPENYETYFDDYEEVETEEVETEEVETKKESSDDFDLNAFLKDVK